MSFYTAGGSGTSDSCYVGMHSKQKTIIRHNEHNEVRRQTATALVNQLATAYQKWLLISVNGWANECASSLLNGAKVICA